MKSQEEVFNGVRLQGIPVLLANIAFSIALIWFLVWIIQSGFSNNLTGILVVTDIILFIINTIIWCGFVQIEPNEARVMIFFGRYSGTMKNNGYFWVNPFYAKKQLTLRARNLDAEPIKVNDKKGNPVMIGQVLVWRVVDTYKASFEIDNGQSGAQTDSINAKMQIFANFVKVQSDAALRYVAGMYAYDDADSTQELTLRSSGEEINTILEKQLNERLSIAGIEVMEARVNYLAYAPEIAAVMLRRQQADAIISAREKIVEGAVGMVKLALCKLSEEQVIELDNDKKAAMISNLLVVLCSDEPAQPVVNSGTLYN
ncbi:MAG: SPFH domain-containing protein [Dysgonamonadaceae bacterium]|jgi:regulator of protease activity HflC (stomatin/prohibitin superfamily)|nr:SPFH domain-containing protein [Dysgonamonadaceae bacterium]